MKATQGVGIPRLLSGRNCPEPSISLQPTIPVFSFQCSELSILVNENLNRLANNPLIGNYNPTHRNYKIVISKQTTLYYNFDETSRVIDLYIFWNNQRNPEDLRKLL